MKVILDDFAGFELFLGFGGGIYSGIDGDGLGGFGVGSGSGISGYTYGGGGQCGVECQGGEEAVLYSIGKYRRT